MASSIPFRRFPHLVAVEILKSMEAMQILNLCQASRNTKALVRSIIKTNEYEMKIGPNLTFSYIAFGNLQVSDESRFTIVEQAHPTNDQFRTNKSKVYHRNGQFTINEPKVYILYEGDSNIETYLSPDQGLMDVISMLIEVLDIKIASFDYESSHSSGDQMLRVMEYAENCGLIFRSMRMHGQFFIPPVFQYFLDNCDEQAEMTLQFYVPHAFKFKNSYKLKSLKIEKSGMVTYLALSSFLSCSEVKLEKNKMSTDEIRAFLRAWMAKNDSRMKRLEIDQNDGTNYFNLNRMFNGLDAEMVTGEVVDNGEILQVPPNQAYRIRRQDGVGATIVYNDRKLTMLVD